MEVLGRHLSRRSVLLAAGGIGASVLLVGTLGLGFAVVAVLIGLFCATMMGGMLWMMVMMARGGMSQRDR